MTIRVFTIKDYDAAYALWDRTPHIGMNDVDDSKEGIEKYLRHNPGLSFVAEENGEIVGAVLGGHDGRRGSIYHLCVDERFRRMGIGARLTEAAIGALRDDGILKASIVAFTDNEEGNRFWEKMGFYSRPDLSWKQVTIIVNQH